MVNQALSDYTLDGMHTALTNPKKISTESGLDEEMKIITKDLANRGHTFDIFKLSMNKKKTNFFF